MTCFSCEMPYCHLLEQAAATRPPGMCHSNESLSALACGNTGARVAVHQSPAAVKGLTDVEDILIRTFRPNSNILCGADADAATAATVHCPSDVAAAVQCTSRHPVTLITTVANGNVNATCSMDLACISTTFYMMTNEGRITSKCLSRGFFSKYTSIQPCVMLDTAAKYYSTAEDRNSTEQR